MRNIAIDDFKNYKFLSGIEHSPDGKHAAFVLHEVDMEGNKYLSNLHLLDVSSNETRKLTAFNKESSFKWLDEENILFTTIREDKDKEESESLKEFTQVYKINIHGGEADKYIRFNKKVSAYEVLHNGIFLASAYYDNNSKDQLTLDEKELSDELKRLKEEKDYEVLDEIPYWSNGNGFTSRKRNRLSLFDEKGQFIKYLTGEYTNIESIKLSEKKDQAVILSSTFMDKEELYNELSIFDGAAVIKLETKGLTISYAEFLSENMLILTASDMKTLGINENSKFYTYNLENGALNLITEDLDISMYSSVGSDSRYGGGKSRVIDHEELYFTTTQGTDSYIMKIGAEGDIREVMTEEGSADAISVKDGNILFIGMKNTSLQEIYKVENGKSVKLTGFNDWIKDELKLSVPEPLSYTLEDGRTIDGFVLKPADYEEGKPYPALLEIHGGPKTVYGSVFYHELQYFASSGYFVIFCNPRGSDGKGNDFSDIRGKYGDIDYEDLMNFTDLALETYKDIDEDLLFVTGGSYGGFMTNWIIGHTDRFKAAASQRSISNWISMFNTTDIGYYFADDQTAASPWENHDKMWEQSPLKYADKVKTPTLFIHSEEDYRCWITEGLQMFTALKFHGVDSRLCMFRGENHELSRSGKPKHRVRRLTEMDEWFKKYKELNQ
ncbi:prolyl oligopeptidase family serine peptidase [Proteiniclasticum sp. C24MP]|uniref:S9 family peptidase n=1 Tax=Proteiniclasticum sp. C24MP TaxID=3374101 RepID=UPI0037547B47